ncbi:MAG: helix-turn-helix domain-containing protein [Clostridia bacterium]|nr:helix-turn-helix domain-containing protein [Clostridia bacterium]
MERNVFIQIVSDTIKHIRVNRGHTQERMAEILGISKKTLVQIEKERIDTGWSLAVACCAIFRQDEALQMALGGDPLELVDLFYQQNNASPGEKTMGGKVWWRKVCSQGDYVLQQNIISQHYRILDSENRRWFSSFDEDESVKRLAELAGCHGRKKEEG